MLAFCVCGVQKKENYLVSQAEKDVDRHFIWHKRTKVTAQRKER